MLLVKVDMLLSSGQLDITVDVIFVTCDFLSFLVVCSLGGGKAGLEGVNCFHHDYLFWDTVKNFKHLYQNSAVLWCISLCDFIFCG